MSPRPTFEVRRHGMGGKPGFLVAHLFVLTREAQAIARDIASTLGVRLELHDLGRIRRNPTLVHHHQIAAASYHILEDPGGAAGALAFADLYDVHPTKLRALVQAMADVTGRRLVVLDNRNQRGRLHEHPGIDDPPIGPRVRRNPAGDPVPGEVWTTLAGDKAKVIAVTPTGSRVQVRHGDVGNREWVDRPDFLANYRAPRTRRNPSRTRLARTKRAADRGYFHGRKIRRAVAAERRALRATGDNAPARTKRLHYQRKQRAHFAGSFGKSYRTNPKGRELSVPERHQLRIARDTLKMSDAGARIMGGPTKDEAREIILRLTGRPAPNPREVSFPAGRAGEYVPEHPDRTSWRDSAAPINSPQWGNIYFKTWPSRAAMLKAIEMQEKREPRSGDLRDWSKSRWAAAQGPKPNPKGRKPSRGNPDSWELEAGSQRVRAAAQRDAEAAERQLWKEWHTLTSSALRRQFAMGLHASERATILSYINAMPWAGDPAAERMREDLKGLRGNPRRKRRDFGTTAFFDRFSFVMPREAIEDLSGQGAKDEAAEHWAARVVRPADVTPERLAAELKEYGAWEADELADDAANWRRILWLAAANIAEEEKSSNPRGGPRVVFNRLLGGWYVVTGPHQTPLNGRFNSKAEAQAWLAGGARRSNPYGPRRAGEFRGVGGSSRVFKSPRGRWWVEWSAPPDDPEGHDDGGLIEVRKRADGAAFARAWVDGKGLGAAMDAAGGPVVNPGGRNVAAANQGTARRRGSAVRAARAASNHTQARTGRRESAAAAVGGARRFGVPARAASGSVGNPKGRKPSRGNPGYHYRGPSVDHSLLSPSGRMSKRARAAAVKREGERLFPPGSFPGRAAPTAADRRETLLRSAANLRDLAARGMSPRKYAKEAARLEAEAAALENPRRADRPGNDRDFAATTIRKALKQRSGKAWSVKVGTGTVWGWITIDAPPARRTWHHRLKPGIAIGYSNADYEEYDSGQAGGHTGPAERAELAKLLGLETVHHQGVSIPGGSDYYDEYMDRAQGRVPERVGVPYWDNPSLAADGWVEVTRAEWAKIHRDYKGYSQDGTPQAFGGSLGLKGSQGGTVLHRVRIVDAPNFGRRKGRSPNPRGRKRSRASEVAMAKRTAQMWNEFPATTAKRVRIPSRTIPGTLVKLGDIHSVVYRSNKYDGRNKLHEHRFKRPLPVLTSDPDGRAMHIVGGGYSITGDGIVN